LQTAIVNTRTKRTSIERRVMDFLLRFLAESLKPDELCERRVMDFLLRFLAESLKPDELCERRVASPAGAEAAHALCHAPRFPNRCVSSSRSERISSILLHHPGGMKRDSRHKHRVLPGESHRCVVAFQLFAEGPDGQTVLTKIRLNVPGGRVLVLCGSMINSGRISWKIRQALESKTAGGYIFS
jgi:hypothetical protein